MRRLQSSEPRRAWIVVALYALVFLASSFLHHDLDCHLRTPAHCSACTASPQAPRIETGVGLVPAALPDAGRIESVGPASLTPPACTPHRGRAPPA